MPGWVEMNSALFCLSLFPTVDKTEAMDSYILCRESISAASIDSS